MHSYSKLLRQTQPKISVHTRPDTTRKCSSISGVRQKVLTAVSAAKKKVSGIFLAERSNASKLSTLKNWASTALSACRNQAGKWYSTFWHFLTESVVASRRRWLSPCSTAAEFPLSISEPCVFSNECLVLHLQNSELSFQLTLGSVKEDDGWGAELEDLVGWEQPGLSKLHSRASRQLPWKYMEHDWVE